MKLNKINKNVLLEWAILLFAFIPIIPNIKWVPVAILLLVSLFHFKNKDYNLKWFFVNTSIYLLIVISLSYTNNLAFGLKKLETSFSLFILPLIFFIILPKNIFKERLMLQFMKLFITSSIIFSVIIITYILFDNSIEYIEGFYTNNYRKVAEGIPLIGQHSIYASIFLAIAIIFSSHLLDRKSALITKKFKLFLALSTLVNTTLIIMLSSKGVIISLIIILPIIFFKKLFKTNNKIRALTSLCIITLVVLSLFVYNRRMNEMIRFETYGVVDTNYSNSYRVNIYKCVLQVVKERWLFGYGVGDAQNALDNCYKNENELLLKKTYNSHNQFLDIWIKTGIFGLLVFITFLYLNFQGAIKTNKFILLSILLLYTLNFLTENILVRQSGVILFSFLINFFAVVNYKKE